MIIVCVYSATATVPVAVLGMYIIPLLLSSRAAFIVATRVLCEVRKATVEPVE
jgi:hypothetical protein